MDKPDACRTIADMKKMLFALLFVPAMTFAQDPAEVRRLFEAGRYQQVLEAAGENASPAVLYTAAQSQQKLGAMEQAKQMYGQLSARPENDPWHFIGLSGQQLADDQTDAALASARQATAMD